MTVYYPKITPGGQVLRPGEHPTFKGIRSEKLFDKINFISLMLALFCGHSVPATHSDPLLHREGCPERPSQYDRRHRQHRILLRPYALPWVGGDDQRALDVTNTNMAAPLLAKSINESLFAMISAIAFTTVQGTVSGLILASSGAVTHDLLTHVCGWQLTDHEQVRIAKFVAVLVGAVAIALGIVFEKNERDVLGRLGV